MAFNDWNDVGQRFRPAAPSATAPPVTLTMLDNRLAAAVAVPDWHGINCEACHDAAAEELTSVVFESSGATGAVPPIAKVTLTGLGDEARCMCAISAAHQPTA